MDLERSLERLRNEAPRLAALQPGERVGLLRTLRRRFYELAPRLVALDCAAKGIAPETPLAGEAGFDGPAIILRYLEELARTLEGREGSRPGAPRESAGRHVVDVLPRDTEERLILPGWRAEAWLAEGAELDWLFDAPSSLVRDRGEVVLVLGAGNVSSIGVVDALQQVFVFGRACMFKASPVNGYLAQVLELAFAPLVKAGWFAFAYGGSDVGAFLCTHPAVDAVHVTGAYETHEAIVWGADPEVRALRKARGEPLLAKPVTSELGNVSPVVVVPGAWSDRELDHAARSIAGTFSFNAGFNCNASKLLVTSRAWPLRERLLDAVAAVLARTPTRRPYYPGSREKYERFTNAGGRVQKLGTPREDELPWALVSELEPSSQAPVFRHEPFCAVLSEVALAPADPVEFMEAAVRFLNERVWGTLNAMLIAHEATTADATLAAAVERTLRDLRYGCVGLNVWPAVGYGLGTLPWGGHPSSTLSDVQSGLGWGHNALLLRNVEKGVVRGSLLPLVKPFWYADHRTRDKMAARYADYLAQPSVWHLARIGYEAARG